MCNRHHLMPNIAFEIADDQSILGMIYSNLGISCMVNIPVFHKSIAVIFLASRMTAIYGNCMAYVSEGLRVCPRKSRYYLYFFFRYLKLQHHFDYRLGTLISHLHSSSKLFDRIDLGYHLLAIDTAFRHVLNYNFIIFTNIHV